MTSESPVVRVQPLTSIVEGQDPVEFVHQLFRWGYDRFFVKIPEGFGTSLFAFDPFFPGYELMPRGRSDIAAIRSNAGELQTRYLQLDIAQLRDLLEYPPIALRRLGAGRLVSAGPRDGLYPIDLEYRDGLVGALLPKDESTAKRTPTKFDARSDGPVVVKILDRRQNQYSYVLHGVRLKDVFVEENRLRRIREGSHTADVDPVTICEEVPGDPYELRNSSPLVMEIFRRAYENRGKSRGEIDSPSLEADFRQLNARYKTAAKPFRNGRDAFAATLANPGFVYTPGGQTVVQVPNQTVVVPADPFLEQGFINERFRKVLYAACCWNGTMEPAIGGDREKLVDLLVGLGFFDRADNDQVQASVFFITDKQYKRNKHKSEFRHIGGDRG
ncbi:TPA: hypothetical protein ACOEOS_000267 [Stenotrophomonas maltophilia]